MPIEEAVARLKSRTEAFVHEVVGGLDHWLAVRHDLASSLPQEPVLLAPTKIVELAKGLEPDAERNRLRMLLVTNDFKSPRQNLGTLSRQTSLVEFSPSTALLLARVLAGSGDTENAISVLRFAVARYPDDPWSNFELATFLSKSKPPQTTEAIRFYTAARALKPETGFDLAMSFENQGRDEEAAELFRELERRNPERFLFLFHFFQSLRKLGDLEESRSVAERMIKPFLDLLEREPRNTRAAKYLGTLLRIIGDPFVSIAALRRAIRILPREAAARERC